MKNLLKVVSLFVVLVVIFLATSKESFNKTISESSDNPSYMYSITVFTNPACYSGSCTATRVSDGVVFPLPSTGSSYFDYPIGMGEGTYNILVCCGNKHGSGQVTITAFNRYPSITINLANGQCIPTDA